VFIKKENEISTDNNSEKKVTRKEFLGRTGKVITLGVLANFAIIGATKVKGQNSGGCEPTSSFTCDPNNGDPRHDCADSFWGYVWCGVLLIWTNEP